MGYRITQTEYTVEFFDGTHATPYTAIVTIEGAYATGVFLGHPLHQLWEDMLTLEKQLGRDIEWYVRLRDRSVIDDECWYKNVAWADYWAGDY